MSEQTIPENASDFITILKCAHRHVVATKSFAAKPDGSIEKIPYDNEDLFYFKEYPINSIDDLYHLLASIEKEPNKLMVRGKCTAQPGSAVKRRKNPKKPGAVFISASHHYVMLDFDKLPYPDHIDPIKDPEGAVRWALSFIPECFSDATCAYQFSSSQNVSKKIGEPPPKTLSIHLWFYCDRKIDDLEWKRFFKSIPNCPVDLALFNAIQIHYTAAPIFKNMEDPLPVRSGILRGASDIVQVPAIPEGEQKVYLKQGPKEFVPVSEDDKQKALRLLVEKYPSEGDRRDFCSAIAGALRRKTKWPPEIIAEFTEAVAESAQDEEAEQRYEGALSICDAVDNDEPAQGIPRLKEYLGADTLKDVLHLLGITTPKTGSASEADRGKNNYLFNAGCFLKERGFPEQSIRDALNSLNVNCSKEHHESFSGGPLPASEVEAAFKAAIKYKGPTASLESTSYKEALDFMNSKYAIVMEAGKTIVIGEERDDALKRIKYTRSSFSDISKFYIDPIITGISKDGRPIVVSKGEWWLKEPAARRFNQVIFRPLEEVPGAYNLWRGYGVEAKKGDWSLFKKHLLENICNGNEEYYSYFIYWLARMIQKPACPAEVAIVMRGPRGVGKGIIVKFVGWLLGQHFLHISNSKHLVGNFNSHLQDTILLYADEAFWAGDKAGESMIKTLITESTIFIEPKGVNAYTAPNYLHIIISSNNDWVIPAGMDERRFFVLDVGDEQQQNLPYFKALTDQMENGGCEALLYDLQRMDISDFDFRTPPKTGALMEQKLLSMTPEQQWLYDKLYEGLWRPHDPHWMENISKAVLQEDYIEHSKNLGVSRRSSQTALGSMLKKTIPGLRSVKSKNESCYVFPSLEECRQNFENKMKQKIEWPEVLDDDAPIEPF